MAEKSYTRIPAAKDWIDGSPMYFYEDMLMPEGVEKEMPDKVKDFRFHSQDVLISTFPRSGTTWTSEMTWLVCNAADTKAATELSLEERVPYIEYKEPGHQKSGLEILNEQQPPRIVKSHFVPQHFNAFSQGHFKVILVMRNIKDVLVSLFHFNTDLFGFKGSWDDAFEMFRHDIMYYGSWLKHCMTCWELKDKPNVLLLRYEDAKRNQPATIRRISEFLNKPLSEEEIQAIANYTSLSNMKKVFQLGQPDTKYDNFIRKGMVGEWREWFTDEQLEFVNGLLETAADKGLVFDDSI